jgi:CheY-like chemotaxis protein
MRPSDRLSDFEARLAVLKHKMESGLVDRARTLREMAGRLEGGDDRARKEIKTESHKLRGVAGSYGHHDLTEAAAQLEQRASISPPAAVGQMARELADLAEARGRKSTPPQAEQTARSKQPNARSDEAEEARNAAKMNPRSKLARGSALRVLAMDDDPVTQRLLLLTLQKVGGFITTIVASAGEALTLLETQSFDVVMSDAMMPDMNGRDFRRTARSRGASMPIIILSAASPDELGWALDRDEPGAWLRKPFKPTQLVQDILRIAEQHRR